MSYQPFKRKADLRASCYKPVFGKKCVKNSLIKKPATFFKKTTLFLIAWYDSVHKMRFDFLA